MTTLKTIRSRNEFYGVSALTADKNAAVESHLPSGTYLAHKVPGLYVADGSSSLVNSGKLTGSDVDISSQSRILTSAVAASTVNTVGNLSLTKRISENNEIGYVNLLNQIYNRSVRRGFTCNLLVTGSSCLGKSTFVNSLLMTDFYNADLPNSYSRYRMGRFSKPVEAHTVMLNERKVHVNLTVLDTPGFGDKIDNSDCIQPLLDELEERFLAYLKRELQVNRQTHTNGSAEFTSIHLANDPRVHVCLYFLPPNTNGLRQFDVEAMRRLHNRVNLVPVIGKADSLTVDEFVTLKSLINRQLREEDINVYRFEASSCTGEVATSKKNEDTELAKYRKRFPFAVVGSNVQVVKSDGSKVRGRNYPWGVVETDSLEHNDFIALKTLLINSHLQDLIDRTHFLHYAAYRSEQLATIDTKSMLNGSTIEDGVETQLNQQSDEPVSAMSGLDEGPLYQLEVERREHEAKLARLEAEMESVFEQKVRERAAKFREREEEFERQSARLLEKTDEEMRLLEEQERQFQIERAEWESSNKESLLLVSGSLDVKEKSKTKRLGIF